MKYEFGVAIMYCSAENSADKIGNDTQARFTLCSDAVVAKMSSGFAQFIHPGSPVFWSHNHRRNRQVHRCKSAVSASCPRALPRKPLLGLYALMPLASFLPYRPNDDHWAAAISANPTRRPVSCLRLSSNSSAVRPLRQLQSSKWAVVQSPIRHTAST